MKSRRGSHLLLLGCLGVASACRALSVCAEGDAADCAPIDDAQMFPSQSSAGEGAERNLGGGAASGATSGGSGEEPTGGSGEEPTGGSGEEPTGGQSPASPIPLVCKHDHADCDGARLTGCETNLTWNAHHCGACGARCEGACSGSRCESREALVTGHFASDLVQTGPYLYALMSNGSVVVEAQQLVRITSLTGEVVVLADQLPLVGDLTLASDQIFLWGAEDYWGVNDPMLTHEVYSYKLEGGLVKQSFSASSLGFSRSGLYLTHPDNKNEKVELYLVTPGQTVKQLIAALHPRILCSSPESVFIRYGAEQGEPGAQLGRLHNTELTPLGRAPETIIQSEAVEDNLFLLVQEPSGYELWSFGSVGEPIRTALLGYEHPANGGRMVLTNGASEAVFAYTENGQQHLRAFSNGSAEPAYISLGLPSHSSLVHVDRQYVWYNWGGSIFEGTSFVRARRADLFQ